MKKLLILLLLWPAAAFAQRPGAVTTFTLTDTTSDALHVGCAVGSSTCTGGIKAGPIDVSTIISAGAISIASNVPGVTTNKLYNNGGTLTWNGSAVAIGGAVGPGTAGKLTKFTGANAVGDSICTESGTTITCVNTVSATTLTGTLSTAAQPNVTTMAGLTSAITLGTVGTIGIGTWQGTKVGLLYGGTNLDMTATGGTSQFLKQNSLGGAITVVRPSLSDLSDAASVATTSTAALLASANTFTTGPQTISLSQNSSFTAGLLANVNAGNAADVTLAFGTSNAATNEVFLTAFGGSHATRANVFDINVRGAGRIALLTSATERWGVNAAGDWTFGASSKIADSSGSPSVTAGCGSSPTILVGTADFAFSLNTGSTASTTCGVTLGHAATTGYICTANASTAVPIGVSTTGSVMTLQYSSATALQIAVHCRGY